MCANPSAPPPSKHQRNLWPRCRLHDRLLRSSGNKYGHQRGKQHGDHASAKARFRKDDRAKKNIVESLTQSFGSSFPRWPRNLTEHLQACRLLRLANPMAAVIHSGSASIHSGTIPPVYIFLRFRQRNRQMAHRQARMTHKEKTPAKGASSCFQQQLQISRITGMIKGRRLVLFWIYRFRSLRIFSLITP